MFLSKLIYNSNYSNNVCCSSRVDGQDKMTVFVVLNLLRHSILITEDKLEKYYSEPELYTFVINTSLV